MKIPKKYLNKRLSRSKQAVSDIIADLLTIVMVVVLMSGIFLYATTLPGPTDSVYTQFNYSTPSLVPVGSNYGRWINVTNAGGQPLTDWNVNIYLFINGTQYSVPQLYIHDGIKMGDNTTWKTGVTWSYLAQGLKSTDSVKIVIVSKEPNQIIWDEYLTGLPDSSPIIGMRGTDPEIPYTTEYANFYCDVTDANNDVKTVTVDLTSIGGSSSVPLSHTGGLRYVTGDTTYVTERWAGKIITFKAVDAVGHLTTANYTLNVIRSTETETGYEPSNFMYSKNIGFNIFEKADWQNNNFDIATPRYSFVVNSTDAAVVVVSKSLLNTATRNFIEVVKISDKTVVYTSEKAFTPYRFISGYYTYESFLNIKWPVFQDNERYLVNVILEDNSNPNKKVAVSHEISTGDGGLYPEMNTYEFRADTNITTSFWNNDIIEVKISSDYFPAGTTWFNLGGDVIIRDYSGGTQMHTAPLVSALPYYWNGAPVSNVYKIDTKTYGFAINLTAVKSGDSWVTGRNQTYTITYDMFVIQNTSTVPPTYYKYLLTTDVRISSPNFVGGLAVGLVEGVSPNNGGAGLYYEGNEDWIQSSSMLYYKNDNTWIPPTFIDQDFWNAHRPQTLLCDSGDLNGDGAVTEVISYYASTSPHNYQTDNNFANTNDPTSWSRINLYRYNGVSWAVTELRTINSNTQVKSLIMANIDQDNDLDVIYGMTDGRVYIGRNNGDNPSSWTWYSLRVDNPSVKSIAYLEAANLSPGAISNDNSRGQSIIIGCTDGSVYILKNTDGFGSWSGTFTSMLGTTVKLINLPATTKTLSSMAVGDVDADGSSDLVVMRTSNAGGGDMYVCYNAELNLAAPTYSQQILSGDTTYKSKTNITLGKFVSKDPYLDIAIMVPDKGIYFIEHQYIGAVHVYTELASFISYLDFNTPATTTRVALLSCMISGDIDGDGLDDLMLGTLRNPWGETIGGTTYYNRMSKGAVFVLINGDATVGGYQRYLVDDPGTPIRCISLIV